MIKKNKTLPLLAIVGLAIATVMCGPGPNGVTPTPTLTTTPTQKSPQATDIPGGGVSPTEVTKEPTLEPTVEVTVTPTDEPSPCEGLSGSIQVRALVGPAAAVGLETHAMGSVPFSVTSGGPPYGVEGGGHISFHDQLIEDEIVYDVTFDADIALDGTCEDTPGSMQLILDLDMAWSQVVEVTAPDFHQIYPLAGDNAAIVTFPLINGASTNIGGEGMELVLLLNE
jgi:hypothetical protein